MSIRFQCPHCQAVRTLHMRLLGREIRCPNCEAPVVLPSQEDLDQARRDRESAKQAEALAARERKRLARLESAATAPVATATVATDEDDDEEPMVQRRSLPHDHIDMTPMVDITFLLLIFFMSTANFTLQKSLEVPVQKEQKASTNAVQATSEETQDSVTVQIDEFNSYLVFMGNGTDREASSKQDLIIALEEARSDYSGAEPPDKLIVEAHRDCTHQAVVAALDAARDHNFTRFQVNVVDEIE